MLYVHFVVGLLSYREWVWKYAEFVFLASKFNLNRSSRCFLNFSCLITTVTNRGKIATGVTHGDVIKWKHFPRYWPFVREIHRSPLNSPHKGQWRGALMFSLICAWLNGWVNNHEAGDLRRHRAYYYVIVMESLCLGPLLLT